MSDHRLSDYWFIDTYGRPIPSFRTQTYHWGVVYNDRFTR